VNDHALMGQIDQVDRRFAFLTLGFIASIVFILFSTRPVGEHIRPNGPRSAARNYGTILTLSAGLFRPSWFYASVGHQLVREDADTLGGSDRVQHFQRAITMGVDVRRSLDRPRGERPRREFLLGRSERLVHQTQLKLSGCSLAVLVSKPRRMEAAMPPSETQQPGTRVSRYISGVVRLEMLDQLADSSSSPLPSRIGHNSFTSQCGDAPISIRTHRVAEGTLAP